MIAAEQDAVSQSFMLVKSSIAVGVLFVIVYYVLMGLRHRKWAATGAGIRMFMEAWFLCGAITLSVRALNGYVIGTHSEDYVFVALGLLAGFLVCAKHVVAMFNSIFKPKKRGWEPTTSNATD